MNRQFSRIFLPSQSVSINRAVADAPVDTALDTRSDNVSKKRKWNRLVESDPEVTFSATRKWRCNYHEHELSIYYPEDW